MPRGQRGSRAASPVPSTEQEPGWPPNLKRSLNRNDAELAALTRLHAALRTLKRAIVDEYGEEALVQCVLEDGKRVPVSNVKETKEGGGENDEAPPLADEGDANATTEEEAPQPTRLEQLTAAFLLRMKLRRRLLNRLARRLHRVAHALDGGAVSAPFPPGHGDVVRRFVTEEAERSGFAAASIGNLDNARVIRKGDLEGMKRGMRKERELKGKLEKQRLRRLGKGGGEDNEEEEENPEAMEEVEPKSEVDLLLQGDEEDAALLAELAEYEPGYDKLYSVGPPPPLPPPTPTSPSKKGKSFEDAAEDKDAEEPKAEGAPPADAPAEKQVLQTALPLARTTDPHEVDDNGDYLAGPKSDTATGPSRAPFSLYLAPMRQLHPQERLAEWKRWTREMCEKIPDQATFDELGVGGRGVVFDEENRTTKREAETAVVRGKGKVLRKSVSPEKAEKPGEEDEDATMAEAGAGDEPKAEEDANAAEKKAEGKKGEDAEKKAELPKKQPIKAFSVNPVPSFHYQDLKRVKLLQNEIVSYTRVENKRERVHHYEVAYNKAYQQSIELQQKKATAIADYRKMEEEHKRLEEEFKRTGRQQLATDKSHWERRQFQLKDTKERYGDDAFTREVTNDVLQDMKDRVTVRTSDDVKPDGLGNYRLNEEATKAKREGDDVRATAATVLSHVLDGVERRCRDELAANETFVPPAVSDPHSTIAKYETQETMAQLHARKKDEAKRYIQALEAAFQKAEATRGHLWTKKTEAKGDSRGQTRKPQRSRKSYPTQQQQQLAHQRQMHQQQQLAQQRKMQMMQAQQIRAAAAQGPGGYPVPGQYYQPQPGQPAAASMMAMAAQQAQRNAASTQRHNQVMSAAQNAYGQPAPPANVAQLQGMVAQNLAAGGPPQQISVPGAAVARVPGQGPRYSYGDRYSNANVQARVNSDGTVAPPGVPKLLPDGTFARPSGRQRKGMDWDAVRGVWFPSAPGGEQG